MSTDVFMRYIGSKRNLIAEIEAMVSDKCLSGNLKNNEKIDTVFLDLFSGTGVVAQSFKSKFSIITNDNMFFSYVLARGETILNEAPNFDTLEKEIGCDVLYYLNKLGCPTKAGFIAHNYSPFGSDRMYFTAENALKIDHIRSQIEDWREKYLSDDAYYYLLACLLQAVPFVSNISGVYGAYLKKWDKRAFLDLTLKHPAITNNNKQNQAFNLDSNELVKNQKADICYIDPPYNGRQYTSNYHLLDTIAYADNPKIKGVTGMREYTASEKSIYCSKVRVHAEFERLIADVQAQHIIISYSSDGIMSEESIVDVLKKYCDPETVYLKKIPYRKYKSKIVCSDSAVKEYMFYAQKPEFARAEISTKKKNLCQLATSETDAKHVIHPTATKIKDSNTLLASPLNYIGGKFKLLPQMLSHFPDDIDELVDVFAGGLNVGINVGCKKLIVNDINHFVVDLLKTLGDMPIDELLAALESYIDRYELSKTNREGFLRLRSDYNKNPNPIALYALICYSFNYQIRFNGNLEYNNPFGKDRSSFSEKLRRKLILFNQRLSQIDVDYFNLPFEELIETLVVSKKALFYCDPPYLISTGSYNDGNRGFKNWTPEQEDKLHTTLDKINSLGYRFILSNVTEHKGSKNQQLIEWAKKYNIVPLNFNYNNSSYNTKQGITKEVIVTNF